MPEFLEGGFTTIDGRARALVDLTPGELRATFFALDSYLNAGTYDEQLSIFGSPPGVRAAFRAFEKINGARCATRGGR